jgi:flagellar biosynthesis component FlhA
MYLDDFSQLSASSGSSPDLLPVVTPVAMEVGQRLIPPDPADESPLFKKYIPEMRDHILRDTGVKVPGIRLRGETDLPPETYIILLDEVPVVSGTVQAGQDLWTDAVQFAIVQLEAVLRRNLADFFGVQEVENLLEEWEQDPALLPLISAALPDQVSRLRFARLLGQLVRERVPITSAKELLQAVQDSRFTEGEIGDALLTVRRRLKGQLPGNQPQAMQLEIPGGVEDKIASSIMREGGKTFFAILPEDAQELLTEVRGIAATCDQRCVFVTRDARTRPFVRRLLELEFPDLMVIAREELLPQEVVKEVGEPDVHLTPQNDRSVTPE